jgi:hypothetical protein
MKPRNFIFVLLFVLAMLVACMPNNNDGPVETRHGTSQIEQVPEPSVPEANRKVEGPSLALSAIDSLMWRQPDSALALLLPYFDTCCRDVARNVYPENSNDNSEDVACYVSTAYNRHYAHLLLSELLYKNDPDGLVGINYNAVVTVLVEAFKEQQRTIESFQRNRPKCSTC